MAWRVTARTGATVQYASSRLLPRAPSGQDLVVIALGVNDTLRLRSRRAWRKHLTGLLTELTPHLSAHRQVVLCGVPESGAMPALPHQLRAISCWHGRALDRQMRHIAGQAERIRHVPMPPRPPGAMFAADGFHPNATGYEAWARHIMLAISGCR